MLKRFDQLGGYKVICDVINNADVILWSMGRIIAGPTVGFYCATIVTKCFSDHDSQFVAGVQLQQALERLQKAAG